jgi:hypothetical protein
LDLSAFERFVFRCPPGQAALLPANSFPSGKPLVKFGDTTTYRPFNVVENMTVLGRYHSYTGSAPVTLTKTITGLQFASAYGVIRNLTAAQFTGWGLDLSSPLGLVGGEAVNRNIGTVVSEMNVNRCLTGCVRFGPGRAGEGVTFQSGVAFHAGKIGGTASRPNGTAMEVHADDVRLIQIQPYAPTGPNIRTVGRVRRLMTVNLKPEGNSSLDLSPDWGAVYASNGGEQWIIGSLATRTGVGTCLYIVDVDDSVFAGLLLSGETKSGAQGKAETAVNVTGGSNNVFASCRIVRGRYLNGGPIAVIGDNGTHLFDAVSGWTA